MRVRGKFYVAEVKQVAGNAEGSGEIVLRAATRGAVNSSWSAATPSGTLTMWVNNPSAFTALRDRLGRECYLDLDFEVAVPGDGHEFSPAPEGHYLAGKCVECELPAERHEPAEQTEPSPA